jgi:replicative DNA helicase
VQSRIKRVRKVGYRDCWHLWIFSAESQIAFLTKVGVNGERGKRGEVVLQQLQSRARRPGADTVPVGVWDKVRDALNCNPLPSDEFRSAMYRRTSPSKLRHAPGRALLHRIAATLDDPEIHKLATSDVYWDRIIEITSIGEHNVYDGTVNSTHNFVANGINLHNSLEQDADMVILLNRPDAFDRDDPRGGEADLILAKHRNGPTKTVTVAHQLHLSRFANMAR